MSRNRVIGRDNRLPWRLPADLRHFKAVTMGKPMIMGRKTYESIGRPLPGRTNIVISRNPDFRAEGVRSVTSLAAALALSEQLAVIDGCEELVVIGGAQIYAETIPLADRLYLTEVQTRIEPARVDDVHFPAFDRSQFRPGARVCHPADARHPYPFHFIRLDRI